MCAVAALRLGEAAGPRSEDVDVLRRTLCVRRLLQGESGATTQSVAPTCGCERVVHAPPS
ncbi:hypothetical protein [Geodermatophilus sp. SYSU D01176]